MGKTCAVCGHGVTLFQRCKLRHRGLVCKTCFEKAGLKKAGIPRLFIDVDDVRALCEMGRSERRAYLAEKRERVRQENEAAIARRAAASVPTCSRCGSTSVTALKKGFGTGKAVLGAALAGPFAGLLAGNVGAKKVFVVCLNCGHRWQAGKR